MIDKNAAELGREAARRLAELGACEIEPGLTDAEFDRIEAEYGIEFADDHRAFLAEGLPVASLPPEEAGMLWENSWLDWRNGDPEHLRYRVDRAVDGLLPSMKDPASWLSAWGPRPEDPEEAFAEARRRLALVPRLVPVYGHRFLPAGRGTYGHPVLSIYNWDMVCHSEDLGDYIDREFGEPERDADGIVIYDAPRNARPTVAFWSDFIG